MKFFFRFVLPVLAILWLAQVSPLGAVVAIALCIIRCAFKSHVLSTMFAHFVYDVLKSITLGFARLIFRRRRD